MATITPREEGYRAFKRLGRSAINPHRGDDRKAQQWLEGCCAAAKEEKRPYKHSARWIEYHQPHLVAKDTPQ